MRFLITGKICKCIPRQSKSRFLGHFLLGGEIWVVGVVHLVVLACVVTATTKKSSIFVSKKVHPRENPGYAYGPNYDNSTTDRVI